MLHFGVECIMCSVYNTRMEVRGYVTKSLFSREEGFVIQESPVTCKKTCFATFQGETLHGRKNPLVVVRFFWVRFPSRPWYLKRYFSEFSTQYFISIMWKPSSCVSGSNHVESLFGFSRYHFHLLISTSRFRVG